MIPDSRRIHSEFGVHLLEICITILPILNIIPQILMTRCNFQQCVKDAYALAHLLAQLLEFLHIRKHNFVVNSSFYANPGK